MEIAVVNYYATGLLKIMLNTKKLLLHICCIGCGAYISQMLIKQNFKVVLYFYNPNIFPNEEYNIRFNEVRKIAKKFNIKYITEKYDHQDWLKKIKGLEQEPEKGKRCVICYYDRLKKTAQKAKELNFDYFGTTLTVSPHKLADKISEIGNKLEKKYNIKYLDKDFKKKDGFKNACKFSKELNLYRQNYCGCEFSKL